MEVRDRDWQRGKVLMYAMLLTMLTDYSSSSAMALMLICFEGHR